MPIPVLKGSPLTAFCSSERLQQMLAVDACAYRNSNVCLLPVQEHHAVLFWLFFDHHRVLAGLFLDYRLDMVKAGACACHLLVEELQNEQLLVSGQAEEPVPIC
jgi:hypothetical protein